MFGVTGGLLDGVWSLGASVVSATFFGLPILV
jgi:hypothetical protein